MTSTDLPPLSIAAIERFLRENRVDEGQAEAVFRLLTTSDPTTEPQRQSDFPTQDGVAPTMLAFPQESLAHVGPTGPRLAPGTRLIPGALLGAGGMGEVYRVEDRSLHRVLAMKVLLPELSDQPLLRDRFFAEAQVTAQLAHPGIPPVHEIGVLEDGRPYFTMKEVKGITLAHLIDEAHRDPGAAGRWTEQRRLEIFQKICAAVAYAHARGVAHCDLKPTNVMVGAFGEVLVMDWGVARLVGASGLARIDEPPVTLEGLSAVESIVAGTPAYMAPEQATRRTALLGPTADVYALGVMLFEILSGERPYRGTAAEVIAQARDGSPPPLPRRPGSAADEALYAIITRAMASTPAARYPDAKAMDDDLSRWREGAMRREKALALVAQASAMEPEIEPAFADALRLQERAGRDLAALGADASIEALEPIWRTQDEATELVRRASLKHVQAEQILQQALALAPDLEAAKSLIARMRHGRHRDAERRRAWDEAARHELALRENDTGAFRDYLEGKSSLSIETIPRCRASLHRVVERARRLSAEFVRDLGETPLLDVELPVGSYVIELAAPDRPPLRLPISLRRRDGAPASRPRVLCVRLPAEGELAPGERYVPAGLAEIGGDDLAPGALPQQIVWLDAFIVQEHPITFADLAEFLSHHDGEPHRRGIFRDGLSVWRHDWPAVGLTWEGASAYARWLARKTGQPWRLLTEIEWEKAARGADGRFFPWGDFASASFCHSRTITRTPRAPAAIHTFPSDRSPYGVRGLGGNVRDWCADAGSPPSISPGRAAPSDAPERVVRGGSWRLPPEAARAAARATLPAAVGYPDVGVRLARSW